MNKKAQSPKENQACAKATSNTAKRNSLPITKQARLNKALALISAKSSQRALEYLIDHPGALTHEIAINCSVGNVSHAFRSVEHILKECGLMVVCFKPNPAHVNQFNECSQVHRWRLIPFKSVSSAANA